MIDVNLTIEEAQRRGSCGTDRQDIKGDNMEHVIAETVNYIKNIFLNDFSGHDYFHSLRVYRVAGTIAEQENADREIVSKIGMV